MAARKAAVPAYAAVGCVVGHFWVHPLRTFGALVVTRISQSTVQSAVSEARWLSVVSSIPLRQSTAEQLWHDLRPPQVCVVRLRYPAGVPARRGRRAPHDLLVAPLRPTLALLLSCERRIGCKLLHEFRFCGLTATLSLAFQQCRSRPLQVVPQTPQPSPTLRGSGRRCKERTAHTSGQWDHNACRDSRWTWRASRKLICCSHFLSKPMLQLKSLQEPLEWTSMTKTPLLDG